MKQDKPKKVKYDTIMKNKTLEEFLEEEEEDDTKIYKQQNNR